MLSNSNFLSEKRKLNTNANFIFGTISKKADGNWIMNPTSKTKVKTAWCIYNRQVKKNMNISNERFQNLTQRNYLVNGKNEVVPPYESNMNTRRQCKSKMYNFFCANHLNCFEELKYHIYKLYFWKFLGLTQAISEIQSLFVDKTNKLNSMR